MGALKIFIYGFNFSLIIPVTVSAMALGNMQLASIRICLLFISFIYSAWSQMFALGLFQPHTGRLTEANPC